MSSVKTYLINNNGDYKIKEHIVKEKILTKNTLEDRKAQMKMAQLARLKKDSEKLHHPIQVPDVVTVELVQKAPSFPLHSHQYNLQQQLQQQQQQLQQQQLKQQLQQQKQQQQHFPKKPLPPPQTLPEEMYASLIKQKKEDITKKIEKEADHILKENGKDTKEDEKQRLLLSEICRIVKINGHPHGKMIPFDTLNDPHVIKELFTLQETLKEVFPSSKLTALHSNAVDKQQFPGVNLVRQIFKEMGYKMKPINISEGYLGTKKLLRREYQILKL